MKKMSLLHWLLLPPAVLLFGFSLAGVGFILSYSPPLVVGVGVLVLVVIAVWFVLVRRHGPAAGSEAALMGRQSSKDGLL